jgi:protein-disulfide isomerase
MQDRLIALATENEERPIQDAVNKLGMARIFDPKFAYVAGPADAKKSFVEFFDYNCPHCRNSVALVRKFFDKHRNDTRFAFVEYPIFGGESVNAARAALAARLQPGKYPAFHFALMSGSNVTGPGEIVEAATKAGLDVDKLTKDLNAPNIDPELVAVQRLADRLHLRGTPVFIVNGKVHSGEIGEAELERLWKS